MHQPVEDVASPTASTISNLSTEPGERASDATASVNDIVARIEAFYRANPALAIVGAASIAAIGIMALKPKSRPKTVAEEISAQLRQAAQYPNEKGAEMAKNLTSMLTNAMKMEPDTIAAYRSLIEDWLQSLRQKAKEIGTNLPTKH